MTATKKPLPPLTARQIAAVDTAGADGRRYAHTLIDSHEQGEYVDPAELLYARQIQVYLDSIEEVVGHGPRPSSASPSTTPGWP